MAAHRPRSPGSRGLGGGRQVLHQALDVSPRIYAHAGRSRDHGIRVRRKQHGPGCGAAGVRSAAAGKVAARARMVRRHSTCFFANWMLSIMLIAAMPAKKARVAKSSPLETLPARNRM